MNFIRDDDVGRLWDAIHEPNFVIVIIQGNRAELQVGVGVVGALGLFMNSREIVLACFRFVVAVLFVAEE